MKKIFNLTSALVLCVATAYSQTIIEYDFEKYATGDSIIGQDGWSVAYGDANSSNNAIIEDGGYEGGKCLHIFTGGNSFGTHTEVDNEGGKSDQYNYKVSMMVKRPIQTYERYGSYEFTRDVIFGSNDGLGENHFIKKDGEFGIRFSSATPQLTIANTKPLDEWVYFSYTFNTSAADCKLREVTFGEVTYTNLNLPMGTCEAPDLFSRFRIFLSGGGAHLYIDNFKVEFVEVPANEHIPASGAEIIVTNVVCQQQYPWNGKVDIDYEIISDDPNADVWVYASGFDQDSNQSMAVRSVTGDGAEGSVKPGQHRMTWNVTADYPSFNSTAFNVKITALTGSAPYLVIDLSAGADAQSYPVSYLNQVPAGGWTDEYKTTKLVMRLLPPGTFMMGSPSDEPGRDSCYFGNYDSNNGERLHKVTLTKPFYIGVFEVTQMQWQLVMGNNPTYYYKGDTRPVTDVVYSDIRGSINGAEWPTHNQVDADTFIGRLRSKANMLFDLPTEAQWEYACRAGTSTPFNNGSTTNSYDATLAKIGRYSGNQTDGKGGYTYGTTAVGSYIPNAWGLYDMHGNVIEYCLDYFSIYPDRWVVDPKGGTKQSYSGMHVLRGGGWHYYYYDSFAGTSHCRSAKRYGDYSYGQGPSTCNYGAGLRLALVQ